MLFSARTTDLRAYTTNDLSEKEPKRTGSGAKKRAKKDETKQKTFSRVGSPHLFRVAEQKRQKKNREGSPCQEGFGRVGSLHLFRVAERKQPEQKIARGLPVGKGFQEWALRIYLE